MASSPAGRFIILVAGVGRGVKKVSSRKVSVILLLLKAATIRTAPYNKVIKLSILFRVFIHPPYVLYCQYIRNRNKIK